MLIEQTISFRVYKNGQSFLGVATVDMPELSYMTETLSGSGIAGEIEAPTLGMTSSMSCTLNWVSQSAEFYSLLNPLEGNLLELRASQQATDPATGLRLPQALRLVLQGEPKSASLGTMETGKKHGNTTVLELSRLLVEVDGVPRLLIDKRNFIHAVNGVDMLAKVRADLGM
ncbi:MAG: phage major tail tube protein [Deltaproteobacteria bacterium]|jgi:P2 family phage contractile tail tube protein|nr:phage major tail tube protein [Deltaproteobacteria bacterium]